MVKIKAAVSPTILPAVRIRPVIKPGKADGNTTVRIMCHLEQPRARSPRAPLSVQKRVHLQNQAQSLRKVETEQGQRTTQTCHTHMEQFSKDQETKETQYQ